jgi:hypothetical protein
MIDMLNESSLKISFCLNIPANYAIMLQHCDERIPRHVSMRSSFVEVMFVQISAYLVKYNPSLLPSSPILKPLRKLTSSPALGSSPAFP